MVTGIRGAPGHSIVFAICVALPTMSDATGEALLFDSLKANIISREFFVKLISGVPKVRWDGLSAIHAYRLPFVLLVVKG